MLTSFEPEPCPMCRWNAGPEFSSLLAVAFEAPGPAPARPVLMELVNRARLKFTRISLQLQTLSNAAIAEGDDDSSSGVVQGGVWVTSRIKVCC